MEYNLLINDEQIHVESEMADDTLTARIGDADYTVSWKRISDCQMLLRVNGKTVNIYTNGNGKQKTVIIEGISYEVTDADLLEQSASRKSGISKAPTEVTAPMPAVVISVNVQEGDIVEKGAGVIVVSAMKMETTLTAPFGGVVSQINVSEGDKVMPGDILVDIDRVHDAETA